MMSFVCCYLVASRIYKYNFDSIVFYCLKINKNVSSNKAGILLETSLSVFNSGNHISITFSEHNMEGCAIKISTMVRNPIL
jgi:hypothetical protein